MTRSQTPPIQFGPNIVAIPPTALRTSRGPGSGPTSGPYWSNSAHSAGHLATVKVASGDEGQLSVVEFLAPRGFGPPLHRHNDEDELFVILDGEVTFRTGDLERVGGEGTVALLPRAVPHSFQVMSETARILNVTAASDGPPQFDSMVTALGMPTAEAVMPGPMDIDPGQVAEVCAAHGIDVLGPPPPPLD